MLGGYPRVFTEARITSRMVRCRGVSTACWAGREVSLLSLMPPNVTPGADNFKHLFEACHGRLRVNATCRHLLVHIDQTFATRTGERLYSNVLSKEGNGHDDHRDGA